MATIAAGAAVGAIPFGPLRFGAAGALFVGLFMGAWLPGVGPQLALFQNFGLTLFAYVIGLAAGKVFFRDLRRNAPLMGAAAVVVILTALLVHPLSQLLNLDVPTAVGVWSGSLTATPAMALAGELTGTTDPAVGYGLSYLVGVIGTIVMILLVASRPWTGSRDPEPATAGQLYFRSAVAERSIRVADLPGVQEGLVRVVAIQRGADSLMGDPETTIQPGDEVVLDGTDTNVAHAVKTFGELTGKTPATVMRSLQTSMAIVTTRSLAGRRLGDLGLKDRFGAEVARVRRDDVEHLATAQTQLKVGDRVLLVAPADRMAALRNYFGNSSRGVSDLDWVSLGLGMASGYLLGMVTIPLPGGASFSLGSAAGALVMGLILGAIGRTGRTVWELSTEINLTLRQFGLMVFLGVVGLISGPAFVSTVLTPVGVSSIIMGAIFTVVTAGLLVLSARLLGQSAPRTYGAMAGITGQPAILSFAMSRTHDSRVTEGYAQLFASMMVIKIALVPFLVG